jgi:glutamate-1-semialdehyde 2,1-aminomutase
MTVHVEARSGSSQAVWEHARSVVPGGVSRDQLYMDPPLFAERGEGAYLFDVAGRRYVDFVNNYTSLIHGHCHPATAAAVAAQAHAGTAFGVPSALEAELASEIVGRLPGADLVRFTNSGTEATMLALQLARHVTGRSRIAKFEGGYHGSHELVRVSVKPADGGPRSRPEPEAEEGCAGFDATDVLPYDDVDALAEIAAARGETWAALVVEPMQGSAGMLPAQEGLLQACRALADRHGFLLVLDEVMTFRHGGHGLQTEWGVRPDLTTLAKIVGGGLPVGAVAGAEPVMAHLAPPRAERIKHAGTFNGNPLTMAAGLATLQAYDRDAAVALDKRGDALRARLNGVLAPFGLSVSGWGSMMNVHGSPQPPACWRDVRAGDRARVERIHRRLLDEGLFVAPRGMIVLSTAHREEHFDALVDGVVAAAEATA